MKAANGIIRQHGLALATIAAAMATVVLGWPGQLTTDTQTQLQEAIHGPITDWHPPITVWLWRLIGTTSGSMLILQVFLHWLGIWCLAEGLRRHGSVRWAWVMMLVGLSPISLIYITVIQKDTLLASFFVAAFGLTALVRRTLVPGMLGFLGTLCRWNGIFALPPMFFVRRTSVSSPRVLAISIVMAAVLVPVTGMVNHDVLMARRTGVERSLQFYDLIGIAHFSGVQSVLPAQAAQTLPCYTPLFWDKLASPGCGYSFSRLPPSLTSAWLRAIMTHPVAYAEHRLWHFNSEIFLIVPPMQQCMEAPAMHRCDLSRHGIIGDFVAKNAFLWPVVWIVAGFVLLFGNLIPLARALTLSGVLYGFSYLLVGVASNFRYFYWTEMAVQIALVHQIGMTGSVPGWRRAGWAVAVILILGYGARLAALV